MEFENREEQFLHEHLFRHFKENKVEIASAITKLFPFLMSLRDRAFISEQMFDHLQEACRNLVPVNAVVYTVLSELERTFSLSLLDELFSRTNLTAYPDLVEISRSFLNVPQKYSLQMDEGRESEDMPRLLPYDREDTEQPAQGKCSCVMCFSRDVPGGSGTGVDSSQAQDATDTGNIGNQATLGKPKSKRRKKKGHNWSRIRRKRPQNILQKGNSTANDHKASSNEAVKMNLRGPARIRGRTKSVARYLRIAERKRGRSRIHLTQKARVAWQRGSRGSRKVRNQFVDFCAPLLPVSCGELKGILFKEKLEKGISIKCILSETGDWLTPREFEIKGGYARSKYWKQSVYCGGRPLLWLMQEGFLPHPPRIYHRKKKTTLQTHNNVDPDMGNSEVCEVCRRRGLLFCCDTCSRAFHRNCHIPPAKIEEMGSLDSQESHRESEILERQMQPEEQLKCEFLLLKVYCCSESSIFAKDPRYHRMRETCQSLKEPMWLNKIKRRLNNQGYSQVKGFVQDIRLIFENHRASYKYRECGQMGIRLETEFEKNLKGLFTIQETNENS
ncbi:hypothetical protein H1C71_020951 [Ictidomys tridecemlineatus]|nr:hypothetical protein H1C71_020951 [Ictidomys tridecemlineatus]